MTSGLITARTRLPGMVVVVAMAMAVAVDRGEWLLAPVAAG